MNIQHGEQYIKSLTRVPSRSYCPSNWNNHKLRPKLPVRDAVLIFDHLGYLIAYKSPAGVLIEHKDSNRIVHDLEGIFIGYENELGEFIDLTIEQETITDVAVPQNLAQVPPPAHENHNYDDSGIEALCIEKERESKK